MMLQRSETWAERAKGAQDRRAKILQSQEDRVKDAIWRRENRDQVEKRGDAERVQAWFQLVYVVRFNVACDRMCAAAAEIARDRLSKVYSVYKIQNLARIYIDKCIEERNKRTMEAIARVTWKFRLCCRVKKRITARKLCVRFFRDFGYAQFAFVIYRFRHNVVRLQRYCRSYHQTTHGRLDALLLQARACAVFPHACPVVGDSTAPVGQPA